MLKKTAGAMLFLAMVLPLFVSAQNEAICSVTRTLARGMNGSDITILQNFLKTEGYFGAIATGYFGPITEASLANWQLDVGIIASITEGGVYGPKTRAYVRERFCGGAAAAPAAQCPAAPPLPTQPLCSGSWNKTYNAQQCHVGWTCVVTPLPAATNESPFISAITGPTKLKTDQSGTWKVTATDPENDALSFSIIWGDEGNLIAQLLELADLGTSATTNTSFTHAYTTSGYYTIVIFAKDTANNDTKATFSVTIEAPPPPAPPQPIEPVVNPTIGTPPETQSQSTTYTGPTGGTASCGATPHEGTVCYGGSCWHESRCCNGKWFSGGNIIGPGPSCLYWVGSYLDQIYRSQN